MEGSWALASFTPSGTRAGPSEGGSQMGEGTVPVSSGINF